ncbi:MAG TPA: hypothetical protein DCZ95_14690 [Verrucomicrobia bacterium]|nr:MAG: hypothetical protein A2X46_18205 [Lentisphaerae bacterium GWF2_57_35]HBA85331.1 hypothetical protein [Verrucomicrobiota bacterium]
MPIRNRPGWIFMMAVLLLAVLVAAPGARAQSDLLNVNAILIRASNDPAPLDTRLDAIEYKLRRLFQFEHYRFMGEGSATLGLPGDSVLSLGRGNRMEIHVFTADRGRIRSQVRWFQNDAVLLTTTVVMTKNVPVVLGGVPDGNGTLIVALTVR